MLTSAIATELSVIESALAATNAPEELVWLARRLARAVEQGDPIESASTLLDSLRRETAILTFEMQPRWNEEVRDIALAAMDRIASFLAQEAA